MGELHRTTTKALLRVLPRSQRDTVLAILRAHPLVTNEELIEALWGDDPDGGPLNPKNTIFQYLWQLRHQRGLNIVSRYGRGHEFIREREMLTRAQYARTVARILRTVARVNVSLVEELDNPDVSAADAGVDATLFCDELRSILVGLETRMRNA